MYLTLLLSLLCLMLVPGYGQAALYTFVDSQGVRHFTNVPSDTRAREVKPGAKWVYGTSRQQKKKKAQLVRHLPQKRPNASTIEEHIRRISLKHQVDPLLIKAIIKTESNFNPYAVSPHGAQGLMQLMPETAKELQVTDPFDVYQNIAAGTRYFRSILDTYRGDLQLSLAAYNAGPGNVARFGKVPHIPETMAYVRKVIQYYRSYQRRGNPSTSINVRHLVTIN